MGSVGSTTRHAGPFAVTDARFPAGAHLDVHTHERVTFAVMVAGSFDLVIAGRRLPCPAGTVFTEPRVSDADANGDSNVPAWFARVEELIHDRFREPLRMEQLAVEAGVHPSHLARVFRSRYGASPGAYLRRLRLEWAADRLAASDAGVSTVALEAGFADQSHFTRAFRRRYGVPPARYRQMRS
jgi:AraC-like DNA-binding protein